jgi:hypothetical protein
MSRTAIQSPGQRDVVTPADGASDALAMLRAEHGLASLGAVNRRMDLLGGRQTPAERRNLTG